MQACTDCGTERFFRSALLSFEAVRFSFLNIKTLSRNTFKNTFKHGQAQRNTRPQNSIQNDHGQNKIKPQTKNRTLLRRGGDTGYPQGRGKPGGGGQSRGLWPCIHSWSMLVGHGNPGTKPHKCRPKSLAELIAAHGCAPTEIYSTIRPASQVLGTLTRLASMPLRQNHDG